MAKNETTTGQKIYALRSQRGLTQDELAYRAGVSRPTVSRAEWDDGVGLATLQKLAAVFGVDVRDLL